MTYWPWWMGGLALAGVMLLHWVATHRMMAVSGRYTALVDQVRSRSTAGGGEEFDDPSAHPAPQTLVDHLVFLACLAVGGLVSAAAAGRVHVTLLLDGVGFTRLTHGSAAAGVAILIAGGICVGFGTRMAGGCTSGHGMCGVSRLQTGSLLATVGFFGTGVLTALALGWLR
jgi:uncharacterized membrane protein YedE/YeeE